MERERHDQSGLTQRAHGFYTGSMSGEGGQEGGLILPNSYKQTEALRALKTPPQSGDNPVSSELRREEITTPIVLRREEIISNPTIQPPSQAAEMPVSQSQGEPVRFVQDVQPPPSAVDSSIAIIAFDDEDDFGLDDLDSPPSPSSPPSSPPPSSAANPEGTPSRERTNQEVQKIEALIAEVLSTTELTQETINAARSLKRWVNIVMENVEEGRESPRRGLHILSDKERILARYKEIDFRTLPQNITPDQLLQQLKGEVSQLVQGVRVRRDQQGRNVFIRTQDRDLNALDIRDYFRDLPNIPETRTSRADLIPSHAEAFLDLIGKQVNPHMFGPGAEHELVDVEGNIHYERLFILLRERGNFLSANSPAGGYNFLNEITVQIANFQLSINSILTTHKERLYARRKIKIQGTEEAGQPAHFGAEYRNELDKKMEDVVESAAYFDAYPAQVAHKRDRETYPNILGKGWGGMDSVANMFNGIDMTEDRYRSLFALPASDDTEEIHWFTERKATGSVGLAMRKGIVAMKNLIDAFPPTGKDTAVPPLSMVEKALAWSKTPDDKTDGAREFYKSLAIGMIETVGRGEFGGYIEKVAADTIRGLYADRRDPAQLSEDERAQVMIRQREIDEIKNQYLAKYSSGEIPLDFDIPARVAELVGEIEKSPYSRGFEATYTQNYARRIVASGFSDLRAVDDEGNLNNSFARLMLGKIDANMQIQINTIQDPLQRNILRNAILTQAILDFKEEPLKSIKINDAVKKNLQESKRAQGFFSNENQLVELATDIFGSDKEDSKEGFKTLLHGLTGVMGISYDDLNMFNDPGKPEAIKNIVMKALADGACTGLGRELSDIDKTHVRTVLTNMRYWTGMNATNEYRALGNDPWSNLIHLGRHITERLRNGQRKFMANFYNDSLFKSYRHTIFDGLMVARRGTGAFNETLMSAIQGGTGTDIDFNKPMHDVVMEGKAAESKFGGALSSMAKLAQTVIDKGDIDVSGFIKRDTKGREVLDPQGAALLLAIEGEARGALTTHFPDTFWNEPVYSGEWETEVDTFGNPLKDAKGRIVQNFVWRTATREETTFGQTYFDVDKTVGDPDMSKMRKVQLALLTNSFKLHRNPSSNTEYWGKAKIHHAGRVLELANILPHDQFEHLINKAVYEDPTTEGGVENMATSIAKSTVLSLFKAAIEILKAGAGGL